MARVLAYTSPARGHLYPATAILLELRRRGHEVAVRTLASEVEAMRRLGLDAAPVDPAIEAIEHDDWQGRSVRDALRRSTDVFARRAVHEVPDMEAAIGSGRPDILLVDINSWGAAAAAAAWGGPWASFCPYPVPLRSPDAPPYGPGFAPARGLLDRLRDAVVRPLVVGAVERSTLPKVNAVRAGLGLAPVRTVNELYTTAPLTLYLTAEPFEYPRRDWPASYVMTGPVAWEPEAVVPAWLATETRPIVLVATSSEYQADEVLVRTAFAALRDEPVLVVATAPSGRIEGLEVPESGRLERFLPHGPILERAACAITHGGMGITQKAIAAGVPVVAVPFGRDQLEVARRVEVSGAGVRLPRRDLDPVRLREAVAAARGRADATRSVAEAFHRAGGAVAAADAVEGRLLGATNPVGTAAVA